MKSTGSFLPRSALASQDERDALARLERVNGTGGLKAVLLTHLLWAEQPSRDAAWRDETAAMPEADALRDDIELLSPATRLPCFEMALARLAKAPLRERQDLILAARRLLTAARTGRPIDRLLWLAMRRAFGESPWAAAHNPAEGDIAELPALEMRYIAHYTAHLARMVPGTDPARDPDNAVGQRWYTAVMARWQPPAAVLEWHRPDVDAVVHALNGLQALSWMQRPLLVRAWIGEALALTRPAPLQPGAADALRLSCMLLDCPLPPELSRLYVDLGAA